MGLVLEGSPKFAKNGLANGGAAGKSGNNIHLFYSGRHYPGCLWFFWRLEKTYEKKDLYGENELAAKFHVMEFIS